MVVYTGTKPVQGKLNTSQLFLKEVMMSNILRRKPRTHNLRNFEERFAEINAQLSKKCLLRWCAWQTIRSYNCQECRNEGYTELNTFILSICLSYYMRLCK